jgi:hemoglobin-like flavoprotein
MSHFSSPGIDRPDADSARQVQQSVARLAGREAELSRGFYSHLFAMLPEVRPLFPEDMAEQRVRLLTALLASISSLDDPVGMETRLQALGEIHYHRGIADDQYQYVGHALIRAIRDVVPGDWSTWLSSAWISVASWMIQHILVGAKRAREQAGSGPAAASLEAAQCRYAGLQAAQKAATSNLAAHSVEAYPGTAQAYPGHHGGNYPGTAQAYPGHHGGNEYAGTWVRYPQLSELGQQSSVIAGAVQPLPDQLPLIPPSASRQPSTRPEEELSLAAVTPAWGTNVSSLAPAVTPEAEAVATVFPRRRRGAGSV